MSLRKLIITTLILKANILLSETIHNDLYTKNQIKKNVSLDISVGKSKLQTNEYTYDDYYRNVQISNLQWKSNDIKILRSNLNIQLPIDFSLNIGGFANLNKAKKGILNDYDKIPNYFKIFDQLEENTNTQLDDLNDEVIEKAIGDANKNMDWNFWSYHNAVLENYYGLHIDIQKLFMNHHKIKLGLGLGYEQDKSKWYAIGGYGVYAKEQVMFPQINKIIELTNKYKIPYIYLKGIFNFTDKLKLSAKYKRSFWASADIIDYHILRDLKYIDKSSKKNGKYNSLDLKLTYKITDNLSIFNLYNINRFSPHKTKPKVFNVETNSYEEFEENDSNFYKDKTGVDAKNYSLSLGIKYDF